MPIRLVFHAGSVLFAIRLVPGIGALNDTSWTASVVIDFLTCALLIASKIASPSFGCALETAARKLRVGRPPASFKMLISTAVP